VDVDAAGAGTDVYPSTTGVVLSATEGWQPPATIVEQLKDAVHLGGGRQAVSNQWYGESGRSVESQHREPQLSLCRTKNDNGHQQIRSYKNRMLLSDGFKVIFLNFANFFKKLICIFIFSRQSGRCQRCSSTVRHRSPAVQATRREIPGFQSSGERGFGPKPL